MSHPSHPVASIKSERVFSAASNMVTQKRACFAPEKVEACVIVKSNHGLIRDMGFRNKWEVNAWWIYWFLVKTDFESPYFRPCRILAKQHYVAACTIIDSGTHSYPVSRTMHMYIYDLRHSYLYCFRLVVIVPIECEEMPPSYRLVSGLFSRFFDNVLWRELLVSLQSVLYRYRANLGAHFVASSFDRGVRDAVERWGEKRSIKRNIDSERNRLNLLIFRY